ncbi:MAG: NUDIX hydrolase [Patescibacteria group bacterium]
MTTQFSPIQNNILSKLKNAKSLRYSELQDHSIPNDLFNYHLQFLVKKGLLLKSEEGYSLSDTGIKHVADPIPVATFNSITSLFKINVITIVSRVVDGKLEILNQLRKSNPSYGKIGVMGGVVLKGELMEAAATRKLKAETGLEAEFKTVASERRIMYKEGDLFSDVVFPIAYADSYSGELTNTEFGENMWLSIDESLKHQLSDSYDCIDSITKVLEAIKDGSIKTLPFFYTEVIKTDE